MRRDDQVAAIMQAVGWVDLINEQFARAVADVMALAALAFDDDAGCSPPSLEAVMRLTPSIWSTVKGSLEHGLRDSGIDAQERAEWQAALEAVYRIAGSDGVPPDYGGVF